MHAEPAVDPMALPSDTGFRFIVLLLAVLGACLYISNAAYFRDFGRAGRYAEAIDRCQRLLERGRQELKGSFADMTPEQRALVVDLGQAANDCQRAPSLAVSAWQLKRVALILLLALAVYLVLPWYVRWRNGLRPLTGSHIEPILSDLRSLALESRLSQLPRFSWNPLDPSTRAFAFGTFGRKEVALTGGLIVTRATDPAAFRVTLLHELAHLRNRDVGYTYFSVATGLSFLAFAVASVNQLPRAGDLVRLLALSLLFFLALLSVVRARELLADARVAVREDDRLALARVLISSQQSASWWRKLLAPHPPAFSRANLAQDSRPLLEPDTLGLVVVGALAGFSHQPFFHALYGLTLGASSRWQIALPLLPMVFLLAGALVHSGARSLQLQRLSGGRVGYGRIGLLLGASFVGGYFTSLVASDPYPRNLSFGLLWALTLVVGSGMFALAIGDVVGAWVTRPSWMRHLIVVVAASILTAWFALLINFDIWSRASPAWDSRLAEVWGYPLMAASGVSLVFAALALLPAVPNLRAWWGTVRIGVLAGIIYVGLLLLARLYLRYRFGPGGHRSLLDYAMAAALFQAAAAYLAAYRAPTLAVARGMLAAFVAGAVGTVGFIIMNRALGISVPVALLGKLILNLGFFLALPAAALGLGVRAGFFRLLSRRLPAHAS